jgi:DNA mismatch endonuclease (patch repair protein)
VERALQKTLAKGVFVGVSSMRSGAMRAVRSRNNRSTEIPVKMALVRAGLSGWQLHQRSALGCPDFLFQAESIALFVDGCFWHGCPGCGHRPRTNALYWARKIELNKKRDRRTTRALRAYGYRVLRIWEHEVTSNVGLCLRKIIDALHDVESEQKVTRRKR